MNLKSKRWKKRLIQLLLDTLIDYKQQQQQNLK